MLRRMAVLLNTATHSQHKGISQMPKCPQANTLCIRMLSHTLNVVHP